MARVDALHTLPNLLKLLAARASALLNLADVGRDASLPHTTLTRYLGDQIVPFGEKLWLVPVPALWEPGK